MLRYKKIVIMLISNTQKQYLKRNKIFYKGKIKSSSFRI